MDASIAGSVNIFQLDRSRRHPSDTATDFFHTHVYHSECINNDRSSAAACEEIILPRKTERVLRIMNCNPGVRSYK